MVEDLPMGREISMKVEGRPAFTVKRAAVECELCFNRGEQVENAEWQVDHNDMTVMLCKAHMQHFLDGLADMQGKGEIVEEVFGMPDV